MRRDYFGKIRERVGPYVEGKVDKARNAGVKAAQEAVKFLKYKPKIDPQMLKAGDVARIGKGLKAGADGITKGLNQYPRGFQDGNRRRPQLPPGFNRMPGMGPKPVAPIGRPGMNPPPTTLPAKPGMSPKPVPLDMKFKGFSDRKLKSDF